MDTTESIDAINLRYSELSKTACCLSCGGAINYAEPKEGEVCVDLGSGKGLDVIRMAEEVGPEGKAIGIDASDGMLETAQRRAEKVGASNASFVKAHLEKLPLEDGSVDLVISNCTINHASDKQIVWDEVYRVLKSGGRFVVSDIYSSTPVPAEYRTDPQAIAECWAGAVTREVYAGQLAAAGFDEVQIFEESDPYEKGKIEVSSWTIVGFKPSCCGCDCSCS